MAKRGRLEIILGILAIVSIILLAIESLASLSRGALIGIYVTDLMICIVFAIDFIGRVRESENRASYIKKNFYEIFALIPAVSLYLLGTLPAISTALRALRLIRVARVILLITRGRRQVSRSIVFLRRSHLISMLGITISIVIIGACTVLLLEGNLENAQITSFSDAVWWSISTVTTVGYGDIVPHSIAGRIMGMVLMVVGIGVMAAFISEVSATLVESRINRTGQGDDFRTSVISKIKNGIDNIDSLNESEVTLLIEMIKNLRLKGQDSGEA